METHNEEPSLKRPCQQSIGQAAAPSPLVQQIASQTHEQEQRKLENSPQDVGDCADNASQLTKQKAEVQLHMLKTSLCSFFRKRNTCRHGEKCRYAHGESELRPRPDGSWDPTSERGKRTVEPQEPVLQDDDYVSSEFEEDAGNLRKCIRDLPPRWNSENLKKLLTEQGLAFRKTKKRKRFHVGFVEFENDEQLALAKQVFLVPYAMQSSLLLLFIPCGKLDFYTERVLAKQKLDGLRVHSKELKVADVLPRAWEKKHERNQTCMSADAQNAIPTAEETTKPVDICDVVTPLARFPYEEQLEKKRAEISKVLKRLVRNVRKAVSSKDPLPDWITSARLQGGLCCPFHGVVASPIVDGYRNKCEFTIGYSLDGKRVVGFLLGNYREGLNTVFEPERCQNVSSIARLYARAFQDFVHKSELPVWDKVTNAGFWRLFTVREGRAATSTDLSATVSIAEVMLIVQVCSAGVQESIRATEYSKMAHELAMFGSQACPPLPLTALMVQDHLGISNSASPDSPLIAIPVPEVVHDRILEIDGKVPATFIHDHICNLRFRLSATSFFQVNTLAAEKLYTLAGDWAGLSSDTILFDVCCGTGTIGLTLARRVGMVIGVEMNESAVADACINAEINGIKNCQFICGKAEDVMDSLIEKFILKEDNSEIGMHDKPSHDKTDDAALDLRCMDGSSETNDLGQKVSFGSSPASALERKFTNVVVIVDPPRSGLHPVVIKVLRTHEQIHRLVYVSCNPETLLANAVELCTPKADRREDTKGKNIGIGSWRNMSVVGHARQRMKSMPVSEPFRPVKAIGVDLFPHAAHCEVVMLMER